MGPAPRESRSAALSGACRSSPPWSRAALSSFASVGARRSNRGNCRPGRSPEPTRPQASACNRGGPGRRRLSRPPLRQGFHRASRNDTAVRPTSAEKGSPEPPAAMAEPRDSYAGPAAPEPARGERRPSLCLSGDAAAVRARNRSSRPRGSRAEAFARRSPPPRRPGRDPRTPSSRRSRAGSSARRSFPPALEGVAGWAPRPGSDDASAIPGVLGDADRAVGQRFTERPPVAALFTSARCPSSPATNCWRRPSSGGPAR